MREIWVMTIGCAIGIGAAIGYVHGGLARVAAQAIVVGVFWLATREV